jgi:hypothetical protein
MIFYKSIQILANTYDIYIIGRSESDIKKPYIALNISADIMGLRVNEGKTKYMAVKNDKKNLEFAPHLYIDGQKFERVHRFIYLGSLVNYNNDISEVSGDGYNTQIDAIMGCGSILNHGCSPVKLKLDHI